MSLGPEGRVPHPGSTTPRPLWSRCHRRRGFTFIAGGADVAVGSADAEDAAAVIIIFEIVGGHIKEKHTRQTDRQTDCLSFPAHFTLNPTFPISISVSHSRRSRNDFCSSGLSSYLSFTFTLSPSKLRNALKHILLLDFVFAPVMDIFDGAFCLSVCPSVCLSVYDVMTERIFRGISKKRFSEIEAPKRSISIYMAMSCIISWKKFLFFSKKEAFFRLSRRFFNCYIK